MRGEYHVLRYCHTMLEKLAENEHKGGYEGEDPMWLLERLEEEVAELRSCMDSGPTASEPGNPTADDIARWNVEKRREAADIGNFAMMISLAAYRSLEYGAEHQGSTVAANVLEAEHFIRKYDGTGGRMNISKEERGRFDADEWEKFKRIAKKPCNDLSEAELVCILEMVPSLCTDLEIADERISELQQENQRLRDKVAELEAQAPNPDEELINLDRQRRGEE